MRISVIIPTLDRADSLDRCLESMSKQVFNWGQDAEVIVVDNGSRDDTPEVVKQRIRDFPSLRYCTEVHPGLHAARHKGAKEATGSIIAFIDDDVILGKGWLRAVAESFVGTGASIATGNVLPMYEEKPPVWIEEQWSTNRNGRVLGWLSLMDYGEERRWITDDYVCGCNFIILKEVLRKAGGFHPDSLPKRYRWLRGDGETGVVSLVRKLGHGILFNPDLTVYHVIGSERMKAQYFYSRAYSQGITYSYLQVRSKKSLMTIWPSFALRMIRIFVGVVRGRVIGRSFVLWMSYALGFAGHQLRSLFKPALRDWARLESYQDADVREWSV